MTQPADTDLALLRKRDPSLLEELIRAHTEPLLAGALALGFSAVDAEELVQDSFVAFLDGLDRFEGRSKIRTYLFGILYHKASLARRRSTRERPEDQTDPLFADRFNGMGLWIKPPQGPEDAALSAEAREWVAHCAEALPTSQRMAFFLRESEGRSSDEICNILEVSDTNLRVLLFRARIRLRDCLERKWLKR